jgi:hypothetical protein
MKKIIWMTLSAPFFILGIIIYCFLLGIIYLALLLRQFDIWYANYEINKFMNVNYFE